MFPIVIGSQAGLQFRLNSTVVNMKGPNTGPGFKLHLHIQGDVALVKDHDIAVAPGSHVFVGDLVHENYV